MTGEWWPCILVPVYNHEGTISRVVAQLQASGLPIILVNDGSRASCRAVLRQLSAEHQGVQLVDLPENLGKGGAVKAGLRFASRQGYSHALQIDADGQHAVEDMERFLAAGRANPSALISGHPVYDRAIPAARYYGRYLTQFWVVVNSLSGKVKDAMCGFRLYPLVATTRLLDQEFTGDRMDFDPEIIVRWLWRGGDLIHIPTKVSYPSDGISHFRLWRDNLLITRMHTRLFFGMLWRLPRLVKRCLTSGSHAAMVSEPRTASKRRR